MTIQEQKKWRWLDFLAGRKDPELSAEEKQRIITSITMQHQEVAQLERQRISDQDRRNKIRHRLEVAAAITTIVFAVLCIIYAVIRIKNELQ